MNFGDIKINKSYELEDGRVGSAKFKGAVEFAKGEWIGLELGDAWKGKNNGFVQGVEYFKCKRGQGVFVKVDKIKGVAAGAKGKAVGGKVKRKAGALDTGRADDFEAPEYKVSDTGDMDSERIDTKSAGGSAVKKAGPREIGRADDFDAPDYQAPEGAGMDKERFDHKSAGGKAAKKAGPRDV